MVRWVARSDEEDPSSVRSGSKRFLMNGVPPRLCCQDPFSKGGRAIAQGARKLTVGFMILVPELANMGGTLGGKCLGTCY